MTYRTTITKPTLTSIPIGQAEIYGRDILNFHTKNSDLRKSVYAGTHFSHGIITDSDLAHVEITECLLTNCEFRNVNLTSADLVYCKFVDCIFYGCIFANGELRETEFRNCRFVHADFDHTTISLCQFISCDFDEHSAGRMPAPSVRYNIFSGTPLVLKDHDIDFLSYNFGSKPLSHIEKDVSQLTALEALALIASNSGEARQVADIIIKCATELANMKDRSTLIRTKYLGFAVRHYLSHGFFSVVMLMRLEESMRERVRVWSDPATLPEFMSIIMSVRIHAVQLTDKLKESYARPALSESARYTSRIVIDNTVSDTDAQLFFAAIQATTGVPDGEVSINSVRRGSTDIVLIWSIPIQASLVVWGIAVLLRRVRDVIREYKSLIREINSDIDIIQLPIKSQSRRNGDGGNSHPNLPMEAPASAAKALSSFTSNEDIDLIRRAADILKDKAYLFDCEGQIELSDDND